MTTLRKELEGALNRHSAENESNTPDFILAAFVLASLAAFDEATRARDTHQGREVPDR